MSDFKLSNKVVQSNSLVQQTSWKLNQTSFKLLKVAISCINTTNPTNTVTIKKNDLVQFIDDVGSKNHNYFKKELDKLNVWVTVKDDLESTIRVVLVNKVEWNHYTEEVKVRFSDELMPYLTNLKENFLQYEVENLKCFDSKYGLILYEYLLSKKRCNPNINLFKLSIENLRELTGTTNKYSDFRNFEKKVLITALNDINNNNLEITFTYEKIKKGKSIREIEFDVKMKPKKLDLKYENTYIDKDQMSIDDYLKEND